MSSLQSQKTLPERTLSQGTGKLAEQGYIVNPQWKACGSGSTDHADRGSHICPAVHPGSNVHRQIDAAMAHRRSEVIVPIGAMQRVPLIVKVHDVGNVFDSVVLAADGAFHRLRVE